MSQEFEDVQDDCFAEFGEAVVYTPIGKPPRDLVGIYRSSDHAVSLETGAEVATNKPVLDLRLRDLSPFQPVVNRDRVVVRGQDWTVEDVQPDGEGIVRLTLTNPRRFG